MSYREYVDDGVNASVFAECGVIAECNACHSVLAKRECGALP